ncbi:signal peptidase II [Mycoplasmopsis lipophila]|uniref:signal peptidase II n=1 Tax=Mycoplasmopsis lipophila TaxID=2117 RepID=UPI0038732CC9
MQKIKNFINEWIKKLKENKKRILVAYSIFFLVLIFVVFTDQITKITLFKWENAEKKAAKSGILFNWGIIGSRSVLHAGVTFSPRIEGKTILIQTLSILVFIFLLVLPLFMYERKTVVALIGMMAGGNIGNMIDRFVYINGSVLDILYVPFLEKWIGREIGTFNVADVAIMGGAVTLIIYFVVEMILNYQQQKKEVISQTMLDDKKENDSNKDDSSDKNQDNDDENQTPKLPPHNNLRPS